MSLRSFQFDPSLTREFIAFGRSLHAGGARRVPPFRREIIRQLSPDFYFYQRAGNDHRRFLAYRAGRVAGRIAAMVNAEIRDGDRLPVGLVGFYECVDDDGVAAELLAAAREWLRTEHGVRRIRGPMNFDFWHGYRFLTKGFDREPYYGEPDNPAYYPEQFELGGFAPLRAWNSIEINGREKLEALIAPWRKRHELLLERGYRFVPATRLDLRKEWPALHGLIDRSFDGFPDYTPIPFTEFKALLSGVGFALAADVSGFVYDQAGRAVSFGVIFRDLAGAVRAMNGRITPLGALRFLSRLRKRRRFNFFAAGSLPEEEARGTGVGRAGFFAMIDESLRRGYTEFIFAQMPKDQPIQAFFRRLKIEPQREYTLYEREA